MRKTKFGLSSFLLLSLLPAAPAWADGAAAPAIVLNPASLAIIPNHGYWADMKFPFCPTDLTIAQAEASTEAPALATGAAFAACIAASGGACVPVAMAAGVISAIPGIVSESQLPDISADASQACSQVPSSVSAPERPHWQQICGLVVDAANQDAQNAKNGWVSVASPPLKLSDPVLSWTLNGQPVERVEALRIGEEKLRDSKYPICYSDPSVISQLKSSPTITLGDIVNLTFQDIKQHGGHLFEVPEMQPLLNSWLYGPDQPAQDNSQFVCAYERGDIDIFASLSGQPNGTTWDKVMYENIPTLQTDPVTGRPSREWVTNSDLYEAAKTQAPSCLPSSAVQSAPARSEQGEEAPGLEAGPSHEAPVDVRAAK